MNCKLTLAALAFVAMSAPALADPVKVVAAENFYGDIAAQIGGADVAVTSILSNPDQDPHLFEASADTAKTLADANVAVVNGVDYDPWMEKLLKAHTAPGRKEIVVAALVGRKAGDNPHLWYNPAYMKAAAKAIAADLAAVDPAHKADYDKGEAQFLEFAEAVGREDRRNAHEIRGAASHGLGAGVRLSGWTHRPQGA